MLVPTVGRPQQPKTFLVKQKKEEKERKAIIASKMQPTQYHENLCNAKDISAPLQPPLSLSLSLSLSPSPSSLSPYLTSAMHDEMPKSILDNRINFD